jgi:hypothetical protein
MNKANSLIAIVITSVFSSFAFADAAAIAAPYVAPDLALTPGILCTTTDQDYSHLDYPEQIARCNRNIPLDEKVKVAAAYGNIPRSEWPKYEFDHLLPLCAGGSDDIRNLWPQPIDQAHEKDKLEVEICTAMKAGTMTQVEAVQKVYDWFKGVSSAPHAPPAVVVTPPTSNVRSVTCTSAGAAPLVARFRVLDDLNLDGISVSLNDNGDHEVISASQPSAGKLSHAKSSPLAGLVLFVVSDKGAKDRFDMYLPQHLASSGQAAFTAYVKISFEDTYPNLNSLSCSFDSAH